MTTLYDKESGPPPPQYDVQVGQPVMQQPTSTNTTINIQQPAVVVPTSRPWNSEICDCFDDIPSCIIITLLSTFGCLECYGCFLSIQMGESCCLGGCVPGYLTALRTKLRVEQNITGSICNDCVITACCRPCAMCQITRELAHCN